MSAEETTQLTVQVDQVHITSKTASEADSNSDDDELAKRTKKYEELAADTPKHLDQLRKNETEHPHKHYAGNAPGLRAAVMGANDGLVSVSSLIFGVLGGSFNHKEDGTVIGGAISMALGEWISVYSARDCQEADVKQERKAHSMGRAMETVELAELAHIYEEKGLSPELALKVAVQLSAKDVLQAHLRDELGIDTEDLDNPWKAAGFSFVSFIGGAILPVLVCILIKEVWTLFYTMIGVSLFCMISLGAISAQISGAPKLQTILRISLGGLAGMGLTYLTTWGVSELV